MLPTRSSPSATPALSTLQACLTTWAAWPLAPAVLSSPSVPPAPSVLAVPQTHVLLGCLRGCWSSQATSHRTRITHTYVVPDRLPSACLSAGQSARNALVSTETCPEYPLPARSWPSTDLRVSFLLLSDYARALLNYEFTL